MGKFENGNTSGKDHWFKKNHSGCPTGGKQTAVKLGARIRRHLREHPEDADAIVESLIKHAIAGSHQHLTILLDRVDGKVKTQVDAHVTHRSEMTPEDKQRAQAILAGYGTRRNISLS